MDLIFQRFLEQSFSSLTTTQVATFERMLDETDMDLMDWILERSTPGDPAYLELIREFQTLKPE